MDFSVAPQPSLQRMMKEGSNIPNDMGLLPGTFVTPTLTNRPSLLSTPRARLKLEWARVKTHVMDYIGMLVFKITSKKPRPKLRIRQTAPTALGLHRQMYTAFADGDLLTLRNICADGLLESFKARIATRRRQGETFQWQLHKYTKSARVVSNRLIVVPIVKDFAIRQAVVRIQSRQSLAKLKDGQVVPGTGHPRDVKEYLVIQRLIKSGKEGPWMVWGTTEETTVEKVIEFENNPLQIS